MPFARTNGIRTYYQVHGKGEPVVFVHGLGLSHKSWEPQIKEFSKKYKVIVYDVRGHGKSGKSKGEYSVEMFADDLHELLWSLKIENPVVCGLSLGGMIAQAYALKHPVKALILCDTFVSGKITAFIASLSEDAARKIADVMKKDMYLEIGFYAVNMKDEALKKQLWKWYDEISDAEFCKTIVAAYHFNKANLSKIRAQTLVIEGVDEVPVVRLASKEIRGEIPGAKYFRIKNATHIPNLENPGDFNSALELFLGETHK
jgi:pimeloyl-ACP methyl ester carboxylesterase